MANVVDIALSLGYLKMTPDMLIEAEDVNRHSPNELVILCTGSQGEPMAALARLASGTHRQVEVSPGGDTVILAATPIPGNERNVSHIVDNLFARGVKVIYGSGSVTGMHVSGHASQEELKLMLTLMKPKYFIPIHGEYRMRYQHRLLAEAVGVESENIFVVNNGEVVDFIGSKARQGRHVPNGNTLVDGLGIGDVGHIVLRDRKVLCKIVSGPDIISRGFVYVKESEGLMEEVHRIALTTITQLQEAKTNQWGLYKQALKEAVGKYLYTKTKRRPMILPIIIQVNIHE
jgi:ribonuclease J